MITDLVGNDPREVGPYRLLGRIGAGGMGVVYLASSPGDDVVAVKLIRSDLAQDAGFRARFAREVEAARRVGGVCTARVRDADLAAERPWVVTDFVAGPNLADLVARHGPMPHDQQRALAAGLAEALVAVHAAGVVHRDVKPTNVLCSPEGPRLIDFGIAQATDATSGTLTGQVVGSPSWMAPEQIRGEAAAPPVDMFALGSVLTFAATGRAPFGDGQLESVMYRILHEDPDLGPAGALESELRPVVRRLLDKDPVRRPHPEQILRALAPAVVDPAEAVTRLLDRTWILPVEDLPRGDLAPPQVVADAPSTRRPKRLAAAVAAALAAAAAVVGFALAEPGPGHRTLTASKVVTTVATTEPATTVAPTTAAPTTPQTTAAPTTAAVVPAVATTTPARSLPALMICSGTPQYEPNSMYWCTSACSSYVKDLTWDSWGTQSATGIGTLMTNDGIPNCAQGTWTAHTGYRVTLGEPKVTAYCSTSGQQTAMLYTWTNVYSYPLPDISPPCY